MLKTKKIWNIQKENTKNEQSTPELRQKKTKFYFPVKFVEKLFTI